MGLHNAGRAAGRSGWPLTVQTGAALAGAMGVGRFVFTPVLPLMEAQAHLTSAQASTLATSNYLGYLIGPSSGSCCRRSAGRAGARVAASCWSSRWRRCRSPATSRAWAALRGLAGVASAVIFMVAGNAILTELASGRRT